MTDRGKLRILAMGAGVCQQPMSMCTRADIPEAHCLIHDDATVRRTVKAIRRLDPTLTILYDRATTCSAMMPGYHVYRDIGGGRLVLVTSCQANMNAIWPNGGPRKPGLWLVDALLRMCRPVEDAAELGGRRASALAKKKAEMLTDGFREIGKSWGHRKMIEKVKRQQKSKRERTPKAVVQI